eukprot:245606-Prorocentrum_minimum.AAC.1
MTYPSQKITKLRTGLAPIRRSPQHTICTMPCLTTDERYVSLLTAGAAWSGIKAAATEARWGLEEVAGGRRGFIGQV